MSRAQILRRRLTSRYIFALSLIALLALAAQGLVQYTLVQHTSDSREVNLAGRQRMLSQTIAKDALAIQRSSEGRQQRLESLRETAATWSQVHVGLLDGDEALGLPGLAPGPERSQLDSLTAVVGRVGRSVERFADAYRDGDSTAADEAMSAILAGEQAFLPAMDRVVFAIDEGSREAIERLRWIELSLMVLTLVVLVIEALFLFRPVVRWASDVLERRPDATVSWMRTRAESSETLVRSLRWMLVLAGGSIITFWFVYQAIGGDRYTDPLIWRIVVAACIVSLAGLSLVSRWVRQRLWSLSVVAGSCIIAYFGWLGAVNGFDVPWTIGTLTVSAATVLATAPYARSVWHVWTAVAAYAGMLALSVIGAGAHTSSALLLVGYTVVLACLAGVASTAYVQTRSALREGRRELEMRSRLLRTVIDAIPDAITVKDREGRCMTRNLADAKLLGFDKVEPTIGLSIFDSELPREHARAFHEEDMQVMKTGEPVRDVASRTGFGTGWKETTRVPLRVDGEVTGLVTVMRDVTEQKEAETALVVAKAAAEAREAEVNAQRQLLQTVIDTIPDQIYVKDRHGRATLRNKASASALGFESPADSLGKTDAEVRADGVGDDAYADDLRVIESGEPLLGKKERTPEGWLLTTKVPLKDEEGEVVSLVGVSRDITAEVAAAVEITAARDAAEAATRAKSEFLANMSHEIRTPMNGVVGMTSLLLDTALDMEQREFVETIRTSGDALLTIINDILDFSKIEAGMLDLEAHPFDIRQCVEEALDLVAQPAAEKGVELAYLIEDGVPAIVQSDVTRVRQVLVNLLSNAVKFTPDGSVCVRVSSESRDVTTGSLATVYFAVEDTGIGIADDKLDAIFESFSQADASTTRRFGGTGLGLTICRRLVTMMGGALDVESQPGAGSTFRFSIQAEVAPSERRVFLRRDQPELEGRRVLIVDDNDVNLEILTRLATRWRMPSTQVRSGPLALAAVETAIDAGEPYDLVLLDMQMPEMDGLEVARGLRRIGTRTGSMPVIVMLTSIHREGRFRQEARAAGVQWVLYKPTKPSQLYDTLIGAFGGQASLSSAARAGDKPATAWVARPRASADGASGPGEASPLRILLAEDNAVNQKVALRLLGRLGYSADVVADGAEAVEAVARMDAHNEPYDVVLMDVQMPVMDGHEATRRIRTATLKRQPWVVALTANAMQGDREACLEAGADDYLAKPVQLDTMGEALERANSASVPNPTPAEA